MLFNLFKKKTTEKQPTDNLKTTEIQPEETPKKPLENPKETPKPRVWQNKRTKIDADPGFLKKLTEDIILTPNPDYDLKKKELIEDFEGETVWEYEPTSFPFELLDDGSVVIEDAYKKKATIGTVGEKTVKAVRKSMELGRKPEVTLLGGKFKKVYEDEVEKDSADWSAVIEYEVLKK